MQHPHLDSHSHWHLIFKDAAGNNMQTALFLALVSCYVQGWWAVSCIVEMGSTCSSVLVYSIMFRVEPIMYWNMALHLPKAADAFYDHSKLLPSHCHSTIYAPRLYICQTGMLMPLLLYNFNRFVSHASHGVPDVPKYEWCHGSRAELTKCTKMSRFLSKKPQKFSKNSQHIAWASNNHWISTRTYRDQMM